MDKNKRNLFDKKLSVEELEIEELLNQFEYGEIQVPDELDEKLNLKLKELKPKKYKKWVATAVASILIVGVSYAFVPTFRTFANTTFKYIFGDIGIENAVNNGYKSADAQHINIGGYDMLIKNIYMDEQRISFDAIMETQIDDVVTEYYDGGDYYLLLVESIDASMTDGIFCKYKDGEIRANVRVIGSDTDNFLKGKKTLELKLGLVKEISMSDVDSSKTKVEKLGTTTIKLDVQNNSIETKNIKINQEINDRDLILKIDGLKVSPTMMYLNTYGEVENVGKLQGLDNFKIISESGEIYKSSLEISGIGLENGGWSQTIVPSAYYDKSKKLRLKADGVLVDASKKIKIKLNDKYPKKIDYFGTEITIKNVEYKKGKVIIDLYKPETISYTGFSLLDKEGMNLTRYDPTDKILGIEFGNIDKKESYTLDLGLVMKYKYPINIEIDNKGEK